MADQDKSVPLNQAFAYILAAIFVLCPLLAYRDAPYIFGAQGLLHLILIVAAGGALSMAVMVDAGERLLAIVPGLIAGIGAAWAWHYILHDASSQLIPGDKLKLIVALLGGAAPGFLLLSLLRRKAAPAEVLKNQSGPNSIGT